MDRLAELRRRHAAAEEGGGAERRERQHREGKLSARERIDLLLDEGTFEDGKWLPGRRLNGDENDQGGYWRFDPRKVSTEKVKLYRYE